MIRHIVHIRFRKGISEETNFGFTTAGWINPSNDREQFSPRPGTLW